MKKSVHYCGVFMLCLATLFGACKKSADLSTDINVIPQEILAKISALGFGTSQVSRVDGGYLVEGDILLTEELLNQKPAQSLLRVGTEEQYRTNNLVTPREFSILVESTLPSAYRVAIDSMIARYSALNLSVTFIRVTSGTADITVKAAPRSAQYLASAGFPTSSGAPFNTVLVSRRYLDSWNSSTVISILAHEVGHTIGFRHTDYMGRQFSCGGSATNEGASTVGAVHIQGTPTGADPNSWMLACIGNGVNRPFNANDIIALNYLY